MCVATQTRKDAMKKKFFFLLTTLLYSQVGLGAELAELSEASLALNTAICTGNLMGVEAALNDGADITTARLEVAARNGHADIVRFLIERAKKSGTKAREALINRQNEAGESALYAACARGFDSIAQYLLDEQANPFLTIYVSHDLQAAGDTALTAAVRNCSKTTIKALLEKGGRQLINTTNIRGQSCLHSLCNSETFDQELLSDFLDFGADPNVRDINGVTPFQEACKIKRDRDSHSAALALLLGHGADPEIRDHLGKSALLKAQSGGILFDVTNRKVVLSTSPEGKQILREMKKRPVAPAPAVCPVDCAVCWVGEEPHSRDRHATLHCNHSFHRDCLDRWFAEQREKELMPSCPLCRGTNISERSY